MSTTPTSTTDEPTHQCQAYLGPEPCPNDGERVVDGVLLCGHHADRADVYDYPRRRE